jgi:hypothetical protein
VSAVAAGRDRAARKRRRFGWITSTGVKILLLTQDRPLHEARVRDILRVIHTLFANAICNPLSDPDDQLSALGVSFERKLEAALTASVPALPYSF